MISINFSLKFNTNVLYIEGKPSPNPTPIFICALKFNVNKEGLLESPDLETDRSPRAMFFFCVCEEGVGGVGVMQKTMANVSLFLARRDRARQITGSAGGTRWSRLGGLPQNLLLRGRLQPVQQSPPATKDQTIVTSPRVQPSSWRTRR